MKIMRVIRSLCVCYIYEDHARNSLSSISIHLCHRIDAFSVLTKTVLSVGHFSDVVPEHSQFNSDNIINQCRSVLVYTSSDDHDWCRGWDGVGLGGGVVG